MSLKNLDRIEDYLLKYCGTVLEEIFFTILFSL